jgi:hypothetical protein
MQSHIQPELWSSASAELLKYHVRQVSEYSGRSDGGFLEAS